MSEPALPGALSAVDRLVVSLVAGINMRALYGSEHPALSSHVDRILEAVGTACEEYRKEAITFLAIWLLFIEADTTRTQEFVLRWSPDGGRSFREILRQQWNFGPPDTIREAEDYRVELAGVTVLELAIVPDKSGGEARSSLAQWRLAA